MKNPLNKNNKNKTVELLLLNALEKNILLKLFPPSSSSLWCDLQTGIEPASQINVLMSKLSS